jgi:hypothetical protein
MICPVFIATEEVCDETDRMATGDPENEIFRGVWELAGEKANPGRGGKAAGCT